jgi:diaminohydroxyphosphoribosylaminopyrimidine deaminase/5-amino-6-(5-phosphoribosylamino)uracil reductase
VLVDSRLDAPPGARIFLPPGHVLVYAAGADAARRRALEDAGHEVVDLPSASGKVDLASMLADLARREVNELHVEAGHKLNGSLVREGLVDEWLLYLAPVLLGEGRELARLAAPERLDAAPRLRFGRVDRVGDDLRILARPVVAAATPR